MIENFIKLEGITVTICLLLSGNIVNKIVFVSITVITL